MIYFKLATVLICAILNWIGGAFWHNARRFIMPVLLAVMAAVATKTWWIGITLLPTMGALTIGYGDKSWFRHVFGDAWARFVWMGVCCLGFSLGLIISGHLVWWLGLIYIAGGGTLGITLRKINQTIGDPIFGAWFAVILFLIK